MKKLLAALYILLIMATTQIVAVGVMRVLGEFVNKEFPEAGYLPWLMVCGLGVFAAVKFLQGSTRRAP